jgi:hypothetical protein
MSALILCGLTPRFLAARSAFNPADIANPGRLDAVTFPVQELYIESIRAINSNRITLY